MTSVLFILANTLIVSGAVLRNESYKHVGLDGKTFTENILFQSQVRSRLECARLCSEQEFCLTYTSNKSTCVGHNITVTSETPYLPAPKTRAFVKNIGARPRTCAAAGGPSGPVTIYLDDVTPIEAFCDQDTDGGGWLVFQRRKDASVDFYRDWTDYKTGFGNSSGFWLGLEALHRLTSVETYELLVDMTKYDGTTGRATYSNFYIGDSASKYTLHFDSFTGGNAGDSLTDHKGMMFSTRDADNDGSGTSWHCSQEWIAAWWFNNCFDSSLNGVYQPPGTPPSWVGVIWYHFDGENSLKFAEMKIRPTQP